MENLTNEQIVDIINFYNLCGISEDMYLSSDRVLDLFTLLGISPEYDDNGERIPTVYEQLGIAPKFRERKEVPIVFAIKHKVSKINKGTNSDSKFTFVGPSENKKDTTILKQLKQEYFSAVSNGNMSEATRIYDMIDLLTGGKADYFLAVQYNCVKFYKKMQKQLLIDMFANFVILLVLGSESTVKNGIVKFDKLYKSFVEKELKNSFGSFGGSSISIPKLSNITVNFGDSENEESKKITIKTTAKRKGSAEEEKITEEIKLPEESQGNFVSYVKSKINVKLSRIKQNFARKSKKEESLAQEEGIAQEDKNEKMIKSNFDKSEKILNVLENN